MEDADLPEYFAMCILLGGFAGALLMGALAIEIRSRYKKRLSDKIDERTKANKERFLNGR